MERKLIIELDGGMHGLREDLDAARDLELQRAGFLVLRFRNHQIKDAPDWCFSQILMGLEREIIS